jgi:hypothetical protein
MSESIFKVGDQPVVKYDDKTFDGLAQGTDFPPRLQFFSGKTDQAVTGKIPVNHFGLVINKDNLIDLGTEVDVGILSWRPKAIRIAQDGNVYNYHDPNSQEFKAVITESKIQDSGCFYGPEFLVYVPGSDKIATLLFGSMSARNEAPAVKNQMGKMCTLKSKLIETKKFKWMVPIGLPCSTPPSTEPDPEKLLSELNKFNNPKSAVVEKAEPAAAGEGRER